MWLIARESFNKSNSNLQTRWIDLKQKKCWVIHWRWFGGGETAKGNFKACHQSPRISESFLFSRALIRVFSSFVRYQLSHHSFYIWSVKSGPKNFYDQSIALHWPTKVSTQSHERVINSPNTFHMTSTDPKILFFIHHTWMYKVKKNILLFKTKKKSINFRYSVVQSTSHLSLYS